MRNFALLAALAVLLLAGLLSDASGETVQQSRFLAQIPEGAIVVAPLDGQVTEASFFILRRALKSAEAANARAFVINMDTPGGSLSAAVKILNLLLESKVPTYTWVNTNAGSAGALIALGTKNIYMAPVSAIGAAAPVLGGGQEVPETMSAKIISYYSGYFRSAAEVNGYNPELAEAFINREKELKIGEEIISPKGSLLTLSAQEAVRKIDGKPILARGIAANLTQLADEAGLADAPIYIFQPSGFEQAAKWITMLAPLFLLGGIIGAYLEFKTPGFGVPGFVSACCFLLFFAGHYIAGLTGFEAAALFVGGLLLVLFELLFFPGLLFLSAIGMLMMIAGLLFAMVDYWPSRDFTLDYATIGTALVNFSITIVLAAIIISLLARFLPSLPLFQFLFLRASVAGGPALDTAPPSIIRNDVHAGDVGVAQTPLRPSGKAQFGALIADVVTEGEFLERGASVRVLRIEGGRIFVESAD